MKHALNVKLKKTYGGIELEIQMTAEREVEPDKGIPVFDNLIGQGVEYFKFFEEQHLPHLGNFTMKGLSMQTKIFKALEICVTMKDGKRLYRVKTPEYSEHGINFWPEHMKENGIDPKLVPDTGHKCKEGTTAVIEMVEGAPKRVIRLVKPTS